MSAPNPAVQVTRVTISDCATALNTLESEYVLLVAERTQVERKIAAIRTNIALIRELTRRIA